MLNVWREAFIYKLAISIRVSTQTTTSLCRFSARPVQLSLSLLTVSLSCTEIVTHQVANGAAPDIASRVDIFRRMLECVRITDFTLWTSIDDRIWLNGYDATEKGSASEHDPWRVTMQRTDTILIIRYSSWFGPQAAHCYQTACSIAHQFL